ncbi:octaprenyl diphosphate synthase [Candidatus Erwinia haradaeae]|uniref:Octaprenyl diphosphate synthase n=1 Tax=Candidatus Erwinia haradaeae TaxID=1922217 RepID=A0A451D7K1_9GAMM|nr:octaprenyl diphosphate synthase [Candidatus Erwinia haradaeae]VFP81829.1 Octaprenyl diphosphate synthase [Candidatus Erwinia haradaeae]
MNLQQINQLISKDMEEINSTILTKLHSDVSLINKVIYYIINGGGKRIRPIISVLAARAINNCSNKHYITIAALIECIHTATLLHDDVIDESNMRRGQATANTTFGNSASVLVGDFIYTRAFQMMTSLNSKRILTVMSAAVNIIAEGEVLQLLNRNNPDMTEENYMQIIYSKTAKLFEAATQSSAILAEASTDQERALQDYGRYVGTAFQLIDDLLDYSSNGETLGKNIGNDLEEGKLTLPLLHAMNHGTQEQANLIRSAIIQGDGGSCLEQILETMINCNSLNKTRQAAEREADKAIIALKILPISPWRIALEAIANISVQRFF